MEIVRLIRKRIKLKLERESGSEGKGGSEIEKAPLVYVRYRSELWASHLYVNPRRLRRSEIHEVPAKWVTTIAGDEPRSYDFINSSHIFVHAALNPRRIRDGFATNDRRTDDRRSTDRDDIWHARVNARRSNSPLHSVFIEKHFAGTSASRWQASATWNPIYTRSTEMSLLR